MRKSILLILLAVFCTTICVAAVSTARSTAKSQERKEVRAQRMAQNVEKLKAALAQQSFTFIPNSYSLPYQNPVQMNAQQFYLDVYPQDLDMYLPFELGQAPSFTFDTSLQPYSNYTVKQSADKRTPNTYIVTAMLRNISNNGLDITLQNQNINLSLHMAIDLGTGYTIVTLSPDFSAPVSYTGITR